MEANTKKTYIGCTLCYHSCGIEVEVLVPHGWQGEANCNLLTD